MNKILKMLNIKFWTFLHVRFLSFYRLFAEVLVLYNWQIVQLLIRKYDKNIPIFNNHIIRASCISIRNSIIITYQMPFYHINSLIKVNLPTINENTIAKDILRPKMHYVVTLYSYEQHFNVQLEQKKSFSANDSPSQSRNT